MILRGTYNNFSIKIIFLEEGKKKKKEKKEKKKKEKRKKKERYFNKERNKWNPKCRNNCKFSSPL